MVAVGDELLGTVDQEIFAVGIQTSFRQVEMRAGTPLGERQRGDVLSRGDLPQVVFALILGGLGRNHRGRHAMHAVAQRRRRAGAGDGFGNHAQAQQPLPQAAQFARHLQPE